MPDSFSRRINALAAASILLPTSSASSADDMVIRGKPVCIGDSTQTLVKNAGRPSGVSYERDCTGKSCITNVPVERWIYVHEGIRYRVDVLRDRVISIEHESAGTWSASATVSIDLQP